MFSFKRAALCLVTSTVVACSASSAPSAAGPADVDAGSPSPPAACTAVAASSEVVTTRDDYGTLEGTLEVPAGCVGMTVVAILSGSGPQDRNGNTPGTTDKTDMYKELAFGLRDAGFAVLHYDDPGVAKSVSGLPRDESTITYEIETNQIARWIPVLRADARFGHLALAGHSEGSLTAIVLAQRGSVDAVVSLAGAGRPIGVILREQLVPQLTAAQLAAFDVAIAQVEKGEPTGPLDPPLDAILPAAVQPYFRSWMKYDPKAEIAKLHVPTLLVQGKNDGQVSVLDANLLAQGKPDAKLVFIDDMCHVLKQADQKDVATQTAQYSDPSLPLHPALVPAIAGFLRTLSLPPAP